MCKPTEMIHRGVIAGHKRHVLAWLKLIWWDDGVIRHLHQVPMLLARVRCISKKSSLLHVCGRHVAKLMFS